MDEDCDGADETSVTLTLEPVSGVGHSTPLKNNFSMKSFEIKQIPPFRGSSFGGDVPEMATTAASRER